MSLAFGASRLLIWVNTDHHSQAGFRCWPRTCRPAVRNPKSWLSRKPELDVTVGRTGARCPSWVAAWPGRLVLALVESRQPAPLSRFRSTAVSRLDAVVEVGGGGRGCSLRGAAAGVCMVSVPSAPCVGDCWVAGRELGTVSVGHSSLKHKTARCPDTFQRQKNRALK